MPYQVDWPDAEYHEILPNLFQGGHAWREGTRTMQAYHSTVSKDETWDYVVSAYVTSDEESWPRCDQRLVLFGDTEKGLDEKTWDRIKSVSKEIVDRWRSGQKVLVRCQAGYNRSGLIMALVLMRLGYTADEAIHKIRWRRGRHALINRVFERYVHEREEEYRDPEAVVDTESLVIKFGFSPGSEEE